ncbi:PEP-CTERM sorting domain-containing protein [Komarekiella sp. 'clone 1']|uniref:PEP-CTERM sorting domain-containing protein n=1 Tax=Komarekiella delphini-convector SJRDD-AB1 TaxID=2593771 RepID=A0AA40VSV2_9NOST|nr:PEP-CTERM sorting domain-containing protein [Komarekiella delphini-convector]MBD6618422.1 PEP-CTERM sorting domain-containing protein [Komarekiella delphini-convector SJRDD-AB1]
MKLAKQLSIATAGVALFAAVGAKSAEAASVVFKGQEGNRFDYTIQFDSANLPGDFERLRDGSLLTLSGLSGVFDVTPDYPTRLSVETKEPDFVTLKLINFAQTGKVGTSSLFGNFSLFSSFTTAGLAQWDIIRRNPLGKVATTFEGQVTGPGTPVPEPFTVGGSVVALGFGLWMKRKQAAASQKI